MRAPIPKAGAASVLAAALAGCASPGGVDAEWRDPGVLPALGGTRVLVACEAAETVLVRLCVERMAAELLARGANPVAAPDAPQPAAAGPRDDARYLALARHNGAGAVWIGQVSAGVVEGRGGAGVSLGLGGFRIGGGGSGVGVGVSVPVGGIGGAPAETRYAADARVVEVAGGRLLWTARAGQGGSGDAAAQLAALARRLADAAGKAGLF